MYHSSACLIPACVKGSRMRRRVLTFVCRVGLQCAALVLVGALGAPAARAFDSGPTVLYDKLRAFALGNKGVSVENVQLKRDRVDIMFSGTFYFAEPVAGRVHGAVFLGRGNLRTEPWSVFEKENVKRFLKSELVEATFSTAVLRFTDDTYERLQGYFPVEGSAPPRAQELATKLEERLARETGLNLSARLAVAVLNQDEPGVFFAQFEGGNRGRFSVLIDHQARALTSAFEINGGEKGLLFQYKSAEEGLDIWTAFYNQQDFARGRVAYADAFDLVRIPDYRMEIDLREPSKGLRMDVALDLVALQDDLQLIPMKLNEGLGEYAKVRLNKGVRVVSAALADGAAVGVIHENWETGFSLSLPRALAKNEKVTITLQLEGKDSLWTAWGNFHYPRSTTTWYPRHGYLARSRFDLVFRHKKDYRVVSVGKRAREARAPDGEEGWVTQWVMSEPVAFVTFAIGRFEMKTENIQVAGQKVPIEFYSVGKFRAVKEDFVLAEISNAMRYFSKNFGDYSYGRLGAVYFPAHFGQGFATLLLLPTVGYEGQNSFIAHEVSHQWWGNVVGWRSYRDQWLSEGFAEYASVLYTGLRKKPKDMMNLVKKMRKSLKEPVRDEFGFTTKEKLFEVGPLILGHRVSTRKTRGAYQALIYNKGALVLRMLHFLLSDPSEGNYKWFFDMMQEFVELHRGGWATTESFMQVASRHFAQSPIGRAYELKDLNWFFRQWVYQTDLPSYRLEYKFEPREGGGVMLTGTLYQENVPEDWFMVLPLVVDFPGHRWVQVAVHALGPATSVAIPLPERPKKVELDPNLWVLSKKMSVKKVE